jgi:Concanavalin A-like lectin/glucanases superfamily
LGDWVRKSLLGIATAVLTAAAMATAGPAGASGPTVLAQYNLDEPTGSTVLVDSGPHAINGTIGTHVALNASYHNFPYVPGGTGGTVDPQHLDVVPANNLLNPGPGNFMVSFRINFTLPVGNVMQKGQSGTVGGFWKVQADDGQGKIACSFVSPTGSASVWSAGTLNDGTWHTVTCTRTPTSVTVTVDGTSRTINHTTGNIANTWPLSIGGKTKCDQITVFCDYFHGEVDDVLIQSF